MQNLTISLSTIDGGAFVYDQPSGKALIEELFGKDWGAPPTVLIIEATAEDGRTVSVRVPYDERSAAQVRISD